MSKLFADDFDDAAEHALYAFHRYTQARTLGEQAHWFNRLSYSMSDLASFHRDYDVELGEIDWDKGEEL